MSLSSSARVCESHITFAALTTLLVCRTFPPSLCSSIGWYFPEKLDGIFQKEFALKSTDLTKDFIDSSLIRLISFNKGSNILSSSLIKDIYFFADNISSNISSFIIAHFFLKPSIPFCALLIVWALLTVCRNSSS